MTLVFKDKAGYKLAVGDWIVYGHALGRCAGLQYGRVLGIDQGKSRYYGEDDPTRLLVQGVDADWSGTEPALMKPSRLQFPERVLRITPDQVRPDIRKLLAAL